MKYIVAFITTLFLLFLSFTAIAETPKIGYIDIEHLISSSPQFVQANETIIKEFQGKEKELLDLEKKFKTMVKKFKKEQETLNEADIQTRLTTLRAEEKILQDKASTLKKHLKTRKTEELDKVKIIVDKAIKTIAKIHKFDLILYQNVVYVNKKINITTLAKTQLKKIFE